MGDKRSGGWPRWYKEVLVLVGFGIAVLVALVVVGPASGPVRLFLALLIPAFCLWRYRVVVHDYAHGVVTIEKYEAEPPAALVARVVELEGLGFGECSYFAVHLNGPRLDSQPLADLRTADSRIGLTLMRKRIGFVSQFGDGRWLITANRPFVAHPQFIAQVLRTAKPAELLDAHRQALTTLKDSHGLESITVGGPTTGLIEIEQWQLRQHFAAGHGILTINRVYDYGKTPHPLLVPAL